tara:strand:+ start:735 stop:1028 length:294 start_codon:yes stop_codon:yes gene_type:complete
MNQQFCACCGKGSEKLTEHLDLYDDEIYQGNQQIIRSTSHHYGDGTRIGGRAISTSRHLTLWDGETYRPLKYGSFCKLRCAQEFAEAAVRAGFKRIS